MKHSLLSYGMLLLSLIFWGAGAGAQTGTRVIQGAVVDSSTGEPVIGAYVTGQWDSRSGAVTDIDGKYTLRVPDGTKQNAQIQVSCIGFKTVEMTVSELAASPNVGMNVDSEVLGEVVVVGYGVQKKVSSVGSISQTTGEELIKGGNVNTVSEALQGRLNGVIALNTTGQPGDNAATIYIRGKSTWQNTNPLVLVDGIERDMNDVDFNEIESISVLKDASATAVYGVRGGNGVILLTTKRGSAERPVVNFNANCGLKQPTARLSWADNVTAMQAYNEACANDGRWDNIIPESTFRAWRQAYATGNYGPYNDVFPEIDWAKELIQTAVSQNYNVNVNGHTDKLKYFASVGYQKDGSIYRAPANEHYDPSSWYKRVNWRTNLDFKLTKTTTLSLNVAGNMGTRNTQQYPNLFKFIVLTPVNEFPIKYSDGYWGDSTTRGFNVIADLAHGGQYTYTEFHGWYDVKLNQDLSFLLKGLKLYGQLSYNAASTNMDTIRDGGLFGYDDNTSRNLYPMEYRKYDYTSPIVNADGSVTYPVDVANSGLHQNLLYEMPNDASYGSLQGVSRRLYYEIGINYANTFKGGHEVTFLALMNRQKIDKAGAASFQFPSYTEDWVSRVTYNWKERYLAEFNVSYTGSEKFAPGKRFGLFPSYSVGWRVSEEPWMKPAKKVISNMKIRYSWGKVGNDLGASRFQYIQLFSQTGGTEFGNETTKKWGPGYSEGAIAQPNATWETSVKQDLGLEMTLWKKLRIEADVYDEQRNGILLSPRTTASWVGVSVTSANLGKTKSHGVDLQIKWNDKIGSDVHYSAEFMFTASENRIVFKDDPSNYLDYERDAGKPIGYQRRYHISGNFEDIADIYNTSQASFQTPDKLVPGDFAYLDYNGDGVINDKDKVIMEYTNYPLTTCSFSFSVDWKGFALSAMLYAPFRQYKNDAADLVYEFPEGFAKAQPFVMERWTVANAGSESVYRPALHLTSAHNETDSDFIYTTRDYLRLKSCELSYSLPKRYARALSMSKCMFFVSGNNLFTLWDGDKRIDPETSGQTVYPIVKSYTFGVRASF